MSERWVWLRQKFAIVFLIGLALSVASFVDHLHMSRSAIDYIVAQLSAIQGWEDFVRAAARIFHATLEWWRSILQSLLGFLPFSIPQWLHDPISVLFFGVSRVWSGWSKRRTSPAQTQARPFRERSQSLGTLAFDLFKATLLVLLMIGAVYFDRTVYDGVSFAQQPAQLSADIAIGVAFVLALFWLTREWLKASNQAILENFRRNSEDLRHRFRKLRRTPHM